ARLRARVQRAVRRHRPAHLSLHGRRRRPLSAGDGDRQGAADLRRRAAGADPPGAARQAGDPAALADRRAARPGSARQHRRARRRGGDRPGLPGGSTGGGGAGAGDAAASRSRRRGSAARGRDARSLRAGARGMSLRSALRAYPQFLKTGFASAVAYRAEFLIWMFSTNMPLVMLAIWAAAARSGPVGSYTQTGFAAYYLCALLVRLMTGAWIVWELTMEIRQGVFSLRLLRPIHPLWQMSAENLAAIPMRGVVALPVLIILLWLARSELSHDWFHWLLLGP